MTSQRAYQILVVLLLILPVRIFSQQQMQLFAQKTPQIDSPVNLKARENQNTGHASYPFPFRMEIVNTNFAIQNLPFFCKKEFLFEKNTSVPLRVRLGSLDYVNKLEGKENHWSVVPGN